MKKYLLEEVLVELREHPNKRFTYDDAMNGAYITNEGGKIVWRGTSQDGQPLKPILDNDEWFEVKKPMTFQEVCEVVSEEGNYVEVRLDYKGKIREDFFDDLIAQLTTDYGSTLLADVFIKGKFSISERY